MKTIEERYKSYIGTVGAECFQPKNIVNTMQNTFIAGAQSEHKELTRWNSPYEHRELEEDGIKRTVLLKFHGGDYKVGFYDRYRGCWRDENNNNVIILGWREIHE